jgi:hypothetical protein
MFPRTPSRLLHCGSAILLTGLLTCAQAVELGEVVVRSHLGQPLVADIELSALTDAAAIVQVRLASADVYAGASIEMPALLSSLNMSVMRRDGRQYLHLTSTKALEADHLHLFLELTEGGRRFVRSATLWLTPDPRALTRGAPPAAHDVTPASHDAVAAASALVSETPARSAPAPASHPMRSRTGQRASAGEQSALCAALDQKNASLTAQIVELEDKVRVLQQAIATKPEHAATPPATEGSGHAAAETAGHAAAEPAAGAADASAHAAADASAHAADAAAPTAANSHGADAEHKAGTSSRWWWIGGAGAALAALIGALVFFLMRKRKAGKGAPAAAGGSGAIAKLMARLRPGKGKAAPGSDG